MIVARIGFLAMRDAFHFEVRIQKFLGDISGGFAERRFRFEKLRGDFTFDDDLGVGGNQNVIGFAFHHFDGRSGQAAGDVEFAHAERNPRRRGVSDARRRTHDERGL